MSVLVLSSRMARNRGRGIPLSPLRRAIEAGQAGGAFCEYIAAVDAYRVANPGSMMTAGDFFEVMLFLGYRKTEKRAATINDVCDPDEERGRVVRAKRSMTEEQRKRHAANRRSLAKAKMAGKCSTCLRRLAVAGLATCRVCLDRKVEQRVVGKRQLAEVER